MNQDDQLPAWLDRLVLDQALGSLGPDVRDLLLAYAKDHPPVDAMRAEAREVAFLARCVYDEVPAEAWPSKPRPRGALLRLRPLAAVAAAAVIGVGLGVLISNPIRRPEQYAVDPAVPVVPAMVSPNHQVSSARLGGWSVRAWYEKARADRRNGSAWSDRRESRDKMVRQWRTYP